MLRHLLWRVDALPRKEQKQRCIPSGRRVPANYSLGFCGEQVRTVDAFLGAIGRCTVP